MLPEVLIYTYKQSYSEIITVDVPVINWYVVEWNP